MTACEPGGGREVIDRYLADRKSHPLARSGLLWLGAQGRTFGYDGLSKALGERAKAAGVEGFTPHRCRHTFASRWLAAGGSESGLLAVCGWSDFDMIRHYTRDTAAKRALDEARRLFA